MQYSESKITKEKRAAMLGCGLYLFFVLLLRKTTQARGVSGISEGGADAAARRQDFRRGGGGREGRGVGGRREGPGLAGGWEGKREKAEYERSGEPAGDQAGRESQQTGSRLRREEKRDGPLPQRARGGAAHAASPKHAAGLKGNRRCRATYYRTTQSAS